MYWGEGITNRHRTVFFLRCNNRPIWIWWSYFPLMCLRDHSLHCLMVQFYIQCVVLVHRLIELFCCRLYLFLNFASYNCTTYYRCSSGGIRSAWAVPWVSPASYRITLTRVWLGRCMGLHRPSPGVSYLIANLFSLLSSLKLNFNCKPCFLLFYALTVTRMQQWLQTTGSRNSRIDRAIFNVISDENISTCTDNEKKVFGHRREYAGERRWCDTTTSSGGDMQTLC